MKALEIASPEKVESEREPALPVVELNIPKEEMKEEAELPEA